MTQKLKEIEDRFLNRDKYFTTNYFNKFSGGIFDERLKKP